MRDRRAVQLEQRSLGPAGVPGRGEPFALPSGQAGKLGRPLDGLPEPGARERKPLRRCAVDDDQTPGAGHGREQPRERERRGGSRSVASADQLDRLVPGFTERGFGCAHEPARVVEPVGRGLGRAGRDPDQGHRRSAFPLERRGCLDRRERL